MDDLPYRAEYAKSGRAGCKLCRSPIEKASLRLAAMVQVKKPFFVCRYLLFYSFISLCQKSPFHDGKNPNWFHFACFFEKQRPKAVGDINKFNELRYEDQQKIKAHIGKRRIKRSHYTIVCNGRNC